jgi:hypothetical protein
MNETTTVVANATLTTCPVCQTCMPYNGYLSSLTATNVILAMLLIIFISVVFGMCCWKFGGICCKRRQRAYRSLATPDTFEQRANNVFEKVIPDIDMRNNKGPRSISVIPSVQEEEGDTEGDLVARPGTKKL